MFTKGLVCLFCKTRPQKKNPRYDCGTGFCSDEHQREYLERAFKNWEEKRGVVSTFLRVMDGEWEYRQRRKVEKKRRMEETEVGRFVVRPPMSRNRRISAVKA